ncbi:MAG: hypothetical protein HY712_01780 [candidate division NC10 bacterium]|nr:hypothetical protein [candidate division NC10 bacterium]
MKGVVRLVVSVAVVSGILGAGVAVAASSSPGGVSRQVAGGGVTVTATLLPDGGGRIAIKLDLNTHSVNLDSYKLDAITALRDDQGNAYPLEAVEGASGGGHHREAILRFAKVRNGTKAITLTVADVAGVKERIFRFTLPN